MPDLLPTYPVKHLTNNTLTKPETFTNMCITPNCPNISVPGPYNYTYAMQQQQTLDRGLELYIKYYQPPTLMVYPPVYTSNNRPVRPNYMKY